MKISKRTLIMTLSLVLALSVSAFGTVAYMTDRTSVKNTFTIGGIDITVDETDTDAEDPDPTPTYPDTDVNGDGTPDDIEVAPDGTIAIDPTPDNPEDTDKDIVIKPDDPNLPDVDNDGKPEIDIDGDDKPDVEIEVDPDTDEIIITPIDPETGAPTDDDPIVIKPDPAPDAPRTEEGNDYDLIPGLPQTKDPTITVKANSEDCYVRFRLTINMVDTLKEVMAKHIDVPANDLAFLNEMVDINTTDWQLVKSYQGLDESGNEVTVYEFWYKTAAMAEEDAIKVVTKDEDQKINPLFKTFCAPGYLTGDDVKALSGLEIIANGDAIQTASFDHAKDAWDAFDNQHNIGEIQE